MPQTEEEQERYPDRDVSVPFVFDVWTVIGGWCSACRVRDLRVVAFGGDRCHVAICAFCLARLADEMRSKEEHTDD